MKKYLALFVCFLLVFSFFSITVNAETENGYTYSVIGNQSLIEDVDDTLTGDVVVPVVSILDYAFRDSSVKSVKLPDSVTFIGEGAFINCEKLEKISLPMGVKEIKKDAFSQCFSLKEVKLSGTVTLVGGNAFFSCKSLEKIDLSGVGEIEFSAFRECKKLSSITLSESLETIGESAFFGCVALKEINIPSSVSYIGYDAFSGCSGLTKIGVQENSKYFASVDGVLYNEAVTELYCYPQSKAATSFVMPKTVEKVHWGAFEQNKNLKSITVNFIGTEHNGEFSTGFASVFGDEVPSNVETVVLKEIETVPANAFYGCTSIKKIVLPESVTEIGEGAFSGCTSLTSVNIPKGVKAIGDGAFKNCTSLKKITLPKGVSQGKDVFEGVPDIKIGFIKEEIKEKAESENTVSLTASSEAPPSSDEKENNHPLPQEDNNPEKETKLTKTVVFTGLGVLLLAAVIFAVIIIVKKKKTSDNR